MAKTLVVITTPKAAFSEQELKNIESKLESFGYDVVILAYGNNTPKVPCCEVFEVNPTVKINQVTEE